ncbi:MAG: ATP--guanido phosphotransferase [Lachnospiraceae bacterium]|nr:ATP--guanido phosphotransferase [Lachnospiraceae bacterium]
MAKWYETPGEPASNVIYSRIRLARNWRDYPFPAKMTEEQCKELVDRLGAGLRGISALDGTKYRFAWLDGMAELEKTALIERRAINRSFSKKKEAAGLILSEDERVSIALNGDDHIRIQIMEKGLNPLSCYERADALDDYISDRFAYSFDEKYGYLTAFPTNVGTGLRASVIVHLPFLSRRKNFSSLVADMGRFGTLIRGVYGEGGENFGSLYQVSNQKTLGQTEQEIIELVKKTAVELDNQERRLQKEAQEARPLTRADEAYKSYGILKYARRLTRKDAMEFLSQVMTGVAAGILKTDGPCSIYGLMLGIQPANLLSMAEKPLNKEELDAARADFLRARLPKIRQ